METGKGTRRGAEELVEVGKARQEMKPILLFFAKSRDVLNFGKKINDPEVEATQYYEKEIFGRYAITQLAKEFINIKVDTRKIDRAGQIFLYKTYRVRRAPMVAILDLHGKVLYRLASPKMSYRQLAKVMERAIQKVEREVKRLAQSRDDSPLVTRAKARWAEIEMRDLCDKAAELTFDRHWDLAEKTLKEVLDRKEDNEYKKAAQVGMKEIQAGKLFEKAEYYYKKKWYPKAKELLDKVIKIRESRIYKQQATELLKKVNDKMKK